MIGALLELGSGVAVNYISDELIQRLNAYKDKKAVQKFVEALNNWALEFETTQDGTIAASGAFYNYVKYHCIVERVVSYVLVPDASELPEQVFLKQMEQNMSRDLEQNLGRGLSPDDNRVICDFLGSLLRQAKVFALQQTAPEDKALLYYLCQNNAELSQIKRIMEEHFQCTKEMIQDVLSRLESSQAELQLASPEDETQLPKEFNELIRKCNNALRRSQRMVKVYSWDNLDFKSVYVLPALAFSMESFPYFTPEDIWGMPNIGMGKNFSSTNLFLYMSRPHRSLFNMLNCLTEDELEEASAKEEDSEQVRRLKIDEILGSTDIVYIIGGAGYGKSLFLKNLCINPPQCALSQENPMLIIRGDLKRMIRPDGTFKPMLEYLSECLTNGSLQSMEELPPSFLQRCLQAGQCLILLDALDEVGNDQRNELHRLVISYFQDTGAQNKVCITSRDRGFIPVEKIFCLSIQPITEKDVREYVDRFIALDKFQESEKERFIMQASSLIDKGFVKGFLTLSLLLAIYKNEQELPANKVALYQKCFEYIANARERNKNLLYNSSAGRAYDWDMLSKLMGDATFIELAKLGTPNNRDIPWDAIDGLMTGLYRQRFHSETECRTAIEIFLQFCADRTEVFVPSPNSNTEYRFFHRSFYEFFYANYIAIRTKSVEDTYRMLDGFEVDSELFELLIQLYSKNDPFYLRELIQYAFQQAEGQLKESTAKASRTFDVLVMLMQTVDENDFLERFIRLFLDRGGRISGFHLQVSLGMIGAVFEKNQTFFIQYFEENQDVLLNRTTIDLSKFLIQNQDNYQRVLKQSTSSSFPVWGTAPQSRLLYMWLLRMLPDRLTLIDRIFEKMKTPTYVYGALKVKGSSGKKLTSFAKKVRERPVKVQEQIYMSLIYSL